MYATVRRFEGVTNPGEAIRAVNQNIAPIISQIPGFVAYYWVNADGGVSKITLPPSRERQSKSGVENSVFKERLLALYALFQFEKFCGPLCVLVHCCKKAFAPPCRAGLVRADERFVPQEKARLLFLITNPCNAREPIISWIVGVSMKPK